MPSRRRVPPRPFTLDLLALRGGSPRAITDAATAANQLGSLLQRNQHACDGTRITKRDRWHMTGRPSAAPNASIGELILQSLTGHGHSGELPALRNDRTRP